uniref:TEP1-F n=1 Tax=Clastoptera arizonana TaxID=38151 RepID=A0A1B6DAF4_9HEMI
MAGLGLLIVVAALCCGAQAIGYYTIVAPRVLRPNTEYHVAVSTLGVSEPTTVVVAVGGKQDSGGTFRTSQFVTVEPYVSRIVKLEIGDVGPGSYNLTAEGSGGMNFINSTELEYIHKSYSVFIQTDKAIYKPGHKVQFRAVVLNSHLKPSVTAALDIHITDGKGNRVKQWNRALTTRGVFSGELELSKNPVLGDWNITVNVLDQEFHKGFHVAEYVLPKFEVIVDVPKHATFKDSKVVATIRSKYTYGRPVKGVF